MIKNFPDQMLNDDQKNLKEKLVHFDKEKDTARILSRYADQISEALERGEDLAYKVVPREYEIQMMQAVLDSGICFVEFPTELNGAWYKTIVVQQKDREALLKVQEDVFENFPFTRPSKEQAEELEDPEEDYGGNFDDYDDGYALYDDDCMDLDD